LRTVAELGYSYIELSPGGVHAVLPASPRDDDKVAELKTVLRETGVQLSSILPLYKWSSPDETERQRPCVLNG